MVCAYTFAGGASFVYPGAVHTRFEHSIGYDIGLLAIYGILSSIKVPIILFSNLQSVLYCRGAGEGTQ